MGNQLTKEKVLEINTMEPLLYEPPAPVGPEEIDVVDEEDLNEETNTPEDENEPDESITDNDGQGRLF